MDPTTRSIGAVARESGLTISALRFYDTAGVLRPAQVDPSNGYRLYDADQVAEARLIASLRRVGMSLDDIGDVLAVRHDADEAQRILDRHLVRLEDGLADARRHLAVAHHLIADQRPPATRLEVRAADLRAALAAVRFAASADSAVPALNGVLLDFDGATLRLVATDRFRLAVTVLPAEHLAGPAAQLIAPVAWLDDL